MFSITLQQYSWRYCEVNFCYRRVHYEWGRGYAGRHLLHIQGL